MKLKKYLKQLKSLNKKNERKDKSFKHSNRNTESNLNERRICNYIRISAQWLPFG